MSSPSSTQPLTAPAGQALGLPFARLADWLGRVLWLCCAVSTVTLIVELWGSSSPETLAASGDHGAGTAPDFAALSQVLALTGAAALVVAGVMWLVWQHRLASAGGATLRRSPGWHMASWFLPVANLWLVPANLADLWRIYGAPRRRSEVPAGRPWVVHAWWSSWVGSVAVGSWGAATELSASTLSELQTAGLLRCVAALLGVLAAGFAASLVHQLSWRALLVHTDVD